MEAVGMMMCEKDKGLLKLMPCGVNLTPLFPCQSMPKEIEKEKETTWESFQHFLFSNK